VALPLVLGQVISGDMRFSKVTHLRALSSVTLGNYFYVQEYL